MTPAIRLLAEVRHVVRRNVVDDARAEEFARNVSNILQYEPGPVHEVALVALETIMHHVDKLELPVGGELIDFARDLGQAWERWFRAERVNLGL